MVPAWFNDVKDRVLETNYLKRLVMLAAGERPGYVYLMQSGDIYKIGCTTNIAKRVSHLNTNSPHKVVLLETLRVPDRWKAEHFLHSMFSNFRVKGEWFTFDARALKMARRQFHD